MSMQVGGFERCAAGPGLAGNQQLCQESSAKKGDHQWTENRDYRSLKVGEKDTGAIAQGPADPVHRAGTTRSGWKRA